MQWSVAMQSFEREGGGQVGGGNGGAQVVQMQSHSLEKDEL